ncbi:MAG: hypothetical protein RMZ42_28465 [Nostoc sp. DedQUE05]|uniref:hypothetical protein n=1 Tax=Nostoc sp. DedQUE05 TaxID=3075391 RepID=UPI002AD58C8D|nr:hypothetical protein [Nostoc sp. DedQUE05]MDZ8095841.1 hypothetical protein [Nostoc sp. DedQUE05]
MTRAVGVLSKIASDRHKRQIIVQASEISKGIVTNSTLQVNEVHSSPTCNLLYNSKLSTSSCSPIAASTIL